LRGVLFQFDRLATGASIPVSQAIRQVLGSNVSEFLKRRDGGAWVAARDALLADPQTVVEIV
jgi:hypothetical protein